MTELTKRRRELREFRIVKARLLRIEKTLGLNHTGNEYDDLAFSIQRRVAHEFNLGTKALYTQSNKPTYSYPRQVAMYLIYNIIEGCSYPQIGDWFAGKHHTTVLHAIRKIHNQRKVDSSLNQLLVSISAEFREANMETGEVRYR